MTNTTTFTKGLSLSLTWLYVLADMADNQSVIKWSTTQENNTLQFEIEHSNDGLTYQSIGVLPAAGNSPIARTYKWTHYTPVAGVNYYRIKQLDIDGRFSFSDIVTTLNKNGLTKTIVAPNPVEGKAVLIFPKPADQSVLNVFNTEGQLVLIQKIRKGALQQTVDFSPVPAGVYTVKLRHNTIMEVIIIIKH